MNEFKVGDVVYLKSDITGKHPMVIDDFLVFKPSKFNVLDIEETPHEPQPICTWLNSQGKMERKSLNPDILQKLDFGD
jgi:hypothetical protein